mmetsp:Transcript_62895/g.112168  ORF Transcript_62895/g.112168 Transcript_62895/m.112168 type:complete len:344 (+) Transcript_62895:1567-2598(+)
MCALNGCVVHVVHCPATRPLGSVGHKHAVCNVGLHKRVDATPRGTGLVLGECAIHHHEGVDHRGTAANGGGHCVLQVPRCNVEVVPPSHVCCRAACRLLVVVDDPTERLVVGRSCFLAHLGAVDGSISWEGAEVQPCGLLNILRWLEVCALVPFGHGGWGQAATWPVRPIIPGNIVLRGKVQVAGATALGGAGGAPVHLDGPASGLQVAQLPALRQGHGPIIDNGVLGVLGRVPRAAVEKQSVDVLGLEDSATMGGGVVQERDAVHGGGPVRVDRPTLLASKVHPEVHCLDLHRAPCPDGPTGVRGTVAQEGQLLQIHRTSDIGSPTGAAGGVGSVWAAGNRG